MTESDPVLRTNTYFLPRVVHADFLIAFFATAFFKGFFATGMVLSCL